MPNTSTQNSYHNLRIITGLFGALILTALCYWPSLGGPFLFDDIPNLETLGERGGLVSTERYLEFIATARAGPLGRPLSLASFTLNANDWPTDPRPFRITNLIIHLVNGLLLFFLARAIFLTAYERHVAENLALMCAILWLLHPLLVSTTAYIIQRMTQLCTLFTIAGLLCYLRGRNRLGVRPSHGWWWIIAGMGGFGLLALLSKESGILLPVYALVIELTVYSRVKLGTSSKRVLLAILIAPVFVLVAYMTMNWDSISAGFEVRSFTVAERLMTQATVVVDYLRQSVAPELSGLGIIHDDYPISTGLLSPVNTLISLMVIASLIVSAVAVRKKWPFVSLGILWFFAGHSLEAGPLALELYFEHRNYLPLLGPLIIAVWLLHMTSRRVGRLLPVLVAIFVCIESFITWQAAAMWNSEQRFMRTALLEHPHSLRAQQYVVNELVIARRYDDALQAQKRLVEQFPGHTSTHLSILNLRCLLGILTKQQIDEAKFVLQTSDHDVQIAAYLSALTNNAKAGTCAVFSFDELHAVFNSLLSNPMIAADGISRGVVRYSKGMAYKLSGDLVSAMRQLDLSYAANSDIEIPLQQTVWLLEAGRPGDAELYLSRARQQAAGHILPHSYRHSDIEFLQQEIERRRSVRQGN